jgi:hypothetical protein
MGLLPPRSESRSRRISALPVPIWDTQQAKELSSESTHSYPLQWPAVGYNVAYITQTRDRFTPGFSVQRGVEAMTWAMVHSLFATGQGQ